LVEALSDRGESKIVFLAHEFYYAFVYTTKRRLVAFRMMLIQFPRLRAFCNTEQSLLP